MVAIRNIDELYRDATRLAGNADTALKHAPNVQNSPDLLNSRLLSFE